MREDLLVFERKFGVPPEMFYEAYRSGEEPADASWVLDWSEWAASYQILHERLIKRYRIPAPGLSFQNPNIPFLLEEIAALGDGH
jgi:hypothetical protein